MIHHTKSPDNAAKSDNPIVLKELDVLFIIIHTSSRKELCKRNDPNCIIKLETDICGIILSAVQCLPRHELK